MLVRIDHLKKPLIVCRFPNLHNHAQSFPFFPDIQTAGLVHKIGENWKLGITGIFRKSE